MCVLTTEKRKKQADDTGDADVASHGFADGGLKQRLATREKKNKNKKGLH